MNRIVKLCMVSLIAITLVACGGGTKSTDEVKELLKGGGYKILFSVGNMSSPLEDEDGDCYDKDGDETYCERDNGERDVDQLVLSSKGMTVEYSLFGKDKGYMIFSTDKNSGEYFIMLDDEGEETIYDDKNECYYFFKGENKGKLKECSSTKYAEKEKEKIDKELEKDDLTIEDLKNFMLEYHKANFGKIKKDKEKAYEEENYTYEDFYDIIDEDFELTHNGDVVSMIPDFDLYEGEALYIYLSENESIGYGYINPEIADGYTYIYSLKTEKGIGKKDDGSCIYNVDKKKTEENTNCSEEDIDMINELELYSGFLIQDTGLGEKEFMKFIKEFKIQ